MSSAWAPSARTFFGPLPSSRMESFCMQCPLSHRVRAGWRGLRFPHLPRNLAARVKVLEKLPVLECVHARPETIVGVRAQLSRCGEALEWLLDQFFPGSHPVEDLLAKDEEATVDPHPHVLHVLDAFHATAILDADEVKTLCRDDAHERGHRVVPLEVVDHGRQRQVGNTVA